LYRNTDATLMSGPVKAGSGTRTERSGQTTGGMRMPFGLQIGDIMVRFVVINLRTIFSQTASCVRLAKNPVRSQPCATVCRNLLGSVGEP